MSLVRTRDLRIIFARLVMGRRRRFNRSQHRREPSRPDNEALRFARKYNLTPGAGSDAHVLAGVGTGAVRMRRFSGPEEFLVSLHDAEVLRRPKSLVYLQGLKWVAQAKERVR